MNTLMIEVATEDEALAQAIAAIERNEPQPPRYLFCSQEELFDTLTGNRFAILKALAGNGPIGVRELARRVGRDVRGPCRCAAVGVHRTDRQTARR